MKFFKKTMLAAMAVAISGVAFAGTVTITGTGYISTNVDVAPTSDGNNLHTYSNSGFWVQEGLPEGFPATIYGECKGSNVTTAQWANVGDTFICTATDIDGDGFVNVGGASNPDYSDCLFETVAGWGKYANVTVKGKCGFAGQITPNAIILTWTAEFTVAD